MRDDELLFSNNKKLYRIDNVEIHSYNLVYREVALRKIKRPLYLYCL